MVLGLSFSVNEMQKNSICSLRRFSVHFFRTQPDTTTTYVGFFFSTLNILNKNNIKTHKKNKNSHKDHSKYSFIKGYQWVGNVVLLYFPTCEYMREIEFFLSDLFFNSTLVAYLFKY